MIRNETEYKEAVERITEEAARLKEQRAQLVTMDLSKEEIASSPESVGEFWLG